MSGPPDVDYRSTSARPAWSALPAEFRRSLQDTVSVALGTEIAAVGSSVSSGFTGGFAAPAQLADGRTVFIKAAPDSLHAYGAYQREAEIVPQLPPAVRVPRILATTTTGKSAGGVGGSEASAPGGGGDASRNEATAGPGDGVDRTEASAPGGGDARRTEATTGGRGDASRTEATTGGGDGVDRTEASAARGGGDGEAAAAGGGGVSSGREGTAGGGGEQRWFAVVSEGITGRMPGMPWTQADFDLVTTNCVTIANALSPSPIKDLKPFVDDFGEHGPSRLPEEIRTGSRPLPGGFQPWLPQRLAEIQDLVDLTPESLAGTAAVHGDLRPDNLLIDNTDHCWTVDWNWLTTGAPWIDWVSLFPLAQHHGIDTFGAIKSNPLTTDVPDDHLDSLIAALVAYVLEFVDAPPPLGCTPEIQRHRRLLGWCCLDWLAVRRGW